jgi:exonuclease SbcD
VRILHTADWHLCDRLGRIDRTDDLKARVEAVAGLCEQHSVDVVLVAGDVFSEQASVEQMTAALEHVHRTFAGLFQRGGTVVAVTGNHDRDGKVNMVRAGMRLASPAEGKGRLSAGRMYLVNGLMLASLEAAGERVQLALVPYPTVGRYVRPDDVYHTKEEEHTLLKSRLAGWLRALPARPEFDDTLPTVLVAHLHVQGAQAHSLYKLNDADDVILDGGFLPSAWAYLALGHVHKAQALSGIPNVRYSGSLDRLDFGERDNDCGAVLVEVGPAGLTAEPLWLPIVPTPFHDVTLAEPSRELPGLAGRYPDRGRAIVRVTVTAEAGQSRDEVGRALRQVFPRLHEVRWQESRPAGEDGKKTHFAPRGDFATGVRDYLRRKLQGDSDPDEKDVLELAERFLNAEGRP